MAQKKITRKCGNSIHSRHSLNCRRRISPAVLIILAVAGIIVSAGFITPLDLAAQIKENNAGEIIRNPNIPWRVEADEINYNQNLDEYTASGNVLIYKQNIKLTADFVRLDHKNMKAYAEGNVVLTNGEDILRGASMEMDLDNQIGSVKDGNLFLKENNFHLSGELIKKVGDNTYTIDEGTLTTCDGKNPAWKITGKKVKVKEDGEGTATHVTLWARKMPVIYSPFFYYPARKKRQSGFLIPEGGTSDRLGIYYTQPYFWAIDKSSDATFYAEYMNSRGLRPGMEYRYYLDKWSKGTWMIDGFVDEKIDNGLGDSSEKWGFPDGSQEILRQNQDRYWLRGSHHQNMPWGVQAKLDVDLVSDQDYTREFKRGDMGWNSSKSYFEQVFNRDLDDFNDPIRTNQLNFNKLWPRYSLNAQLRYDLDSTIRNTHNPDTTLQQLPVVEFDGVKQRISTSRYFYNLNSQYIYYWREDGKRTQRLDAHPRFYMPLQFKPFVNLEPSVGLRETLWRTDKEEFGPEDKKFYHRELYDAGLDLFTEIYGVFQTGGKSIEAVKHTIRPQITYEFIPDVKQDDLPYFDSTDRIVNENRLIYSLTNTLTSKTNQNSNFKVSHRVAQENATIVDSNTRYNYNDFFRFELLQSYDIKVPEGNDPDRPFSPIEARLDFVPGKYISVDADAQWSVYDMGLLSHNIATNFWDGRGDSLYVEYRYTKDSDEITLNPTQSLYADLQIRVTDSLSVSADYEYNFLENTRVQTGIGINYKAQCWSFEGRISDSTGIDKSQNLDYEFRINLFGLGGFGI